ncbi:MAG: YfhO family protein [Anaerolineae bacterium]|nr:MAG: YfhO family protein [Anaerolineae bacterium]
MPRMARTDLEPRYREILLVLCILTLSTAVFLKDTLLFGRRLLPADLLTISEPWQSVLGEQGIHNHYLADPIQTHYPRQTFFWEALKQKHFPTWNPYIFLGLPCDPMTVGVFADIGQLVTSLPTLFLPLDLASGIVAALRLVLSGLFTYLLLRHFKASFGGALVAALVFMFGANTIVWLEYPQHLAAQLWMPLVLLFFDRTLARRRWSDALLTTVFLTLMLYNWYLQLTLYMLWLLFLFFMWHVWRSYRQERSWRAIRTMTLLSIVAIGGALLIASVKTLVYLQTTLSSIRALQERARALSTTSLNQPLFPYLASRLVTLFYPTFYGDGIDHIYWGPGNTVEDAQYLGLVPLYLIAIALCCKPRRRGTIVFTGLGICFLMTRLKLPLFTNLTSLIPLAGLGSISRLATVITFLLAIVAGLGLTALEEKGQTRVRATSNAIVGTLAVNVLTVGTAWWLYRKQLRIRPYTSDHLWIAGAVTAGLLLCLYLFLHKRMKRQLMVLGVALLTFIDLLTFGGDFNTTVLPDTIYPRTEATDFLRRDPTPFRVLVLHTSKEPMKVMPSDTLQMYQIPEVGGRNPHLPRQYYDFFAQVMGEPSVTPNGYLLPSRFKKPVLWGMLNVKYVLSDQDLPADQLEGLHLVYANELRIYRNLKWQPRVFTVPEARLMTSQTELFKALEDPAFDPTREALVLRVPKWISRKPSTFTAERVDLTWVGTNDIVAQARLSQPSLLVLSARYDQGWQVYVDGSQREIYRANGILMAVPIEAGEHSVRFVYTPKSRWWNLSARIVLPLLMAGGLFGLAKRAKKKRNDTSIPWATRWTLLALVGLALASLVPLFPQAPMPERPSTPADQLFGTTFGDVIELEEAILDHGKFVSEGQIELTLHWRALQPIKTSYTVFIHLVGPDGQIQAQRDIGPLDGGYPTNMWQPNELVADHHQLTLSDDSPSGQYRLLVGLYNQASMTRLPAFDRNGERWDADSVWLEAELSRPQF